VNVTSTKKKRGSRNSDLVARTTRSPHCVAKRARASPSSAARRGLGGAAPPAGAAKRGARRAQVSA